MTKTNVSKIAKSTRKTVKKFKGTISKNVKKAKKTKIKFKTKK